MTLQERRIGQTVVWQLVGQLTGFDGTGPFEAAVTRLARNGGRTLIIDVGGVTLVDAGGLGVLATVCRVAANLRIRVSLACVPARIRRLLTITRLATVLTIFESVDAALRHTRSTRSDRRGETADAAPAF